MFTVIEEGKKTAVVDEALKGERGVGEIAAEAGVSAGTLRKWLAEHYEANPDDPRRHLIERESARYRLEGGEDGGADNPAEDGGADHPAREDMAKKRKYSEGVKKKAAAMLSAGKLSHPEIAEKLGIPLGTVQSWSHAFRHGDKPRKPRVAKASRLDPEAVAAVRADLEQGYRGATLVSRHKKRMGRGSIYSLQRIYIAERTALQGASLAPRSRTEPQQLPLDATLLSRPEPAAESAPMPASTALQVVRQLEAPSSRMLGDTLAECIEERRTLRGMVTLLQRELEAEQRKVRQYEQLIGEMRR